MLDIKFIRENPALLKEVVQKKGMKVDIDRLLTLDEERRALIVQLDELRSERNRVSAEIPKMKGADKKKSIEAMRGVGERVTALETELRPIEAEFDELMLWVPNIPADDAPIGPDSESNEVVKRVGEPRQFDFPPKSYVDLLTARGLLDLERGVKVSGFRGYYLKGDLAHLQMALMTYAMRKLSEKGFTPMVTPTLVREFALIGSGHFPFGKEEIYQIGNPGKLADGSNQKEPLYLAGTSEPSLLAYFADEVLEEKDLPLKVCGISACYRSEVGSYGKDAKGMFRVHEFWKVEQVLICRADIAESDEYQRYLLGIAEEVLQELELPYHVLNTSTGDMGAGKRRMYDLEVWIPSRNSYGETHSDSNLTDWQTRRLNIRYKDTEGKVRLAYALNNTGIASARTIIALAENHQQADGSIRVPKALVPYLGKESI